MSALTQRRLQAVLNYSAETGMFTWRQATNWRITVGSVAGTIDSKGYRRIKVDGTVYKAHRLAWLYVHGEWPSEMIDHANGEPDDNRLCNLRPATNAENQRNRGANGNSIVGLKGVSWRADCGKFRAKIDVGGTRHYLGYFKTAEEAHAAYLAAAERLHGEFALRRGIEIGKNHA